MTDRELLELAAKAVELPECGWMGPAFMYVKDNTFTDWNPLTDDGDALRLAVKLGMELRLDTDNGFTSVPVYREKDDDHIEVVFERHDTDPLRQGTDPLAATRRAIVRAAAKIGRDMT